MRRRTFLGHIGTLPLIAPAIWSLGENALYSRNAKATMTASMWTYLWDLVDEGYDNSLRRMQDHGLTSVSLATAYHAGKFLTPHNPKRKVVFLEDGSVYFQPTQNKYGKIQPIVNSLVQHGHGLRRVKEYCDATGLETRAWVVCCHNTPLGTRYPDIATQTVFGDILYHNLCPSNPDVRRYLRSLVADIAGTGVTVIELEAMQFQGYTHGFHHEREGFSLPTVVRFLLGLCFCKSCEQWSVSSDVPWRALKQYVASTLETYFANPDLPADTVPGLDSLPHDLFGPFEQWRKSVVRSLAEELMSAAQGTDVRLRPLVSYDAIARRFVAMDLRAVAEVCGGILVPGYVRAGEELREVLSPIQQDIDEAELIVGMHVGFPGSGGKDDLVDRVRVARELGIHSLNFYNYGFLPLPRFGWIKEALHIP